MRRLTRAWSRWIIGAWSGSNAARVEALSGVDDLDEIFRKRKIRWAASVYGRYLPALRDIADRILSHRYEGYNVQFNWMEEQVRMSDCKDFTVEEYTEKRVDEYSDGSRMNEAAAAATARQAMYLGLHATMMDAEMAGVLLALKGGHSCIALDSQGAIQRLNQLYTQPARSWIVLQLQKENKAGCTLMWIRGHAGTKGNEEADRRAKIRAYGGRVMSEASLLTPAGIRHDHRIHSKGDHMNWTRKQLQGLTFITTDRGPIKRWQWIIGRTEHQLCPCGEIQNVVHLRRCRMVADGAGRSIEQCWVDRE